jgi:hypothetical protein
MIKELQCLHLRLKKRKIICGRNTDHSEAIQLGWIIRLVRIKEEKSSDITHIKSISVISNHKNKENKSIIPY